MDAKEEAVKREIAGSFDRVEVMIKILAVENSKLTEFAIEVLRMAFDQHEDSEYVLDKAVELGLLKKVIATQEILDKYSISASEVGDSVYLFTSILMDESKKKTLEEECTDENTRRDD